MNDRNVKNDKSILHESQRLLYAIRKKYEASVASLNAVKMSQKKNRAARVFAKRRLRQTKKAVHKRWKRTVHTITCISHKEGKKAIMSNVKKCLNDYITRLGGEIYDLYNNNMSDIVEQPSVKKIIENIDAMKKKVPSEEKSRSAEKKSSRE